MPWPVHGRLTRWYGPAGVCVRPSQRAPWFSQSVCLPGSVAIPVREPVQLSRYPCRVQSLSMQRSQRTGMIWSMYPRGLATTPAQFGLYTHTVQSIRLCSLVRVLVKLVDIPAWEGFVQGQHL